MDNGNELASSPMSFGASSYVSNGSTCPNNGLGSAASSEPAQSLDSLSLAKLSANLEKLLVDSDFAAYADAEIVVEGSPVGVHRCILASRSQFFHDLFKTDPGGGGESSSSVAKKPRYEMSELVRFGKVGVEAFDVILNYLYTGTGKLKACLPEISTCVDESCAHDACPPAINYAVELMIASVAFQMKELVQLVQRRLLNFVEKAFAEDVVPILAAAHRCQLSQLTASCVHRVAKSDLDDAALDKELPPEAAAEVRALRPKPIEDSDEELREKRVRKILRALDSDDVELMTLLLGESDVTLDDACALHYAVAYCDPKIVKAILGLSLADVRLRDTRGHTVLHAAARRREPSVIVALLERGASPTETTPDGQSAVAICRKLTTRRRYEEGTAKGRETNNDRICIDVLERKMRRTSATGNLSAAAEPVADDLNAKLEYFENRVAFARLFFPAEARLAMEMADEQTTAMYASLGGSKGSTGNLREVDLNETPERRTKRLQFKLQTLKNTVDKGRKYFPQCSEVLDRFLDDERDMPEMYVLEKGTAEEQTKKKMRFMELRDEVHKAFSKDIMAQNHNHSNISNNHRSSVFSSSSSSSPTKLRKRC